MRRSEQQLLQELWLDILPLLEKIMELIKRQEIWRRRLLINLMVKEEVDLESLFKKLWMEPRRRRRDQEDQGSQDQLLQKHLQIRYQ